MKQALYETAKKILAVNKNTLKSLHGIFGFDFENEKSSTEIVELKTPFTLNKVVKDNNITSNKFAVVIILDDMALKTDEAYHKRFKVVMVDETGKFDIEKFSIGWYSDGVDNYYRKADFNDDRKNADLPAYLIMIDKKDEIFTQSPAKRYGEYNVYQNKNQQLKENYINDVNCLNRIRYNKKDIRTCYVSKFAGSVVYGVYNARLENYNNKIDVEYSYYHDIDGINTENDLFDKSGYNVYLKRRELKRQALQLKAKRELNQLQHMDFSKQNEIIRTRIFNTKNDLIEKLQEASFDMEYKRTDESEYKTILNHLEDLNRLYQDYQKHLQMLQDAYNNNNKSYYYSYSTPDAVLKAIVRFNEKLDNMAM